MVEVLAIYSHSMQRAAPVRSAINMDETEVAVAFVCMRSWCGGKVSSKLPLSRATWHKILILIG
jgi:hypothetical protein